MGKHRDDWRLFFLSLLFLICAALPWLWVGEVCWLCEQAEERARRAGAQQAAASVELEEPRLVALTFDDGPRRSTTTALLDGLSQRGVQATFFLVGDNVEVCGDLVCRMEAEGHQVGVHSGCHRRLTGLNEADFYQEVGTLRDKLTALLGHGGFDLRPPYGKVDAGVKRRAGAPIILWSIDPEDWSDADTPRQVEHIVSRADDGDVILLHDIYPSSVETALQVVDILLERGFRFVTVDELFAAKNIPLEPGKCYRSARD